ncbi:hypothetical protein VNI00_018748 [Paramarasmius palmivorus]|uniref:Uncharacterized protein n=1 Tax=Paramarasmius palmivorus TaxID=297713 RepID=A0AAW0AV85_9AGAR
MTRMPPPPIRCCNTNHRALRRKLRKLRRLQRTYRAYITQDFNEPENYGDNHENFHYASDTDTNLDGSEALEEDLEIFIDEGACAVEPGVEEDKLSFKDYGDSESDSAFDLDSVSDSDSGRDENAGSTSRGFLSSESDTNATEDGRWGKRGWGAEWDISDNESDWDYSGNESDWDYSDGASESITNGCDSESIEKTVIYNVHDEQTN